MLEESKNTRYSKFLLQNIFQEKWEDVFLIDGQSQKTFSYKDFFSLVIDTKKKLEKLELKRNDVIAISASNSLYLIALYFASLLLSLKIVPIDPEKGTKEINEILSFIDYKILIYESVNIEQSIKNFPMQEFKSFDYRNDSNYDLEILNKIDFELPFLISFTSGSTGTPKGVVHSFGNLIKSALAFNKKFNFDDSNVFYHNLPMTYMAGILNLFILPLISKSRIVLGNRFNISEIPKFWNLPIKYSANTFWFIPTILELLIKLDRGNDGIEYSKSNQILGLVATAPLLPETKIEFQQKYSIPLFESYGLTETLFVSTNQPGEDKTGSVGKLLDEVNINFLEDNEIIIQTPWMFFNYINFKKSNFLDGDYYRTGDIGKMVDSNLIITERKKDLIIKGGINLSPKKIEDYLKNYEFFNQCVILGIPDKFLGEKIVCFFILKNDDYLDTKLLNQNLCSNLGNVYQIDDFVKIKEIPLNTNGKINKVKIREVYLKAKNDS